MCRRRRQFTHHQTFGVSSRQNIGNDILFQQFVHKRIEHGLLRRCHNHINITRSLRASAIATDNLHFRIVGFDVIKTSLKDFGIVVNFTTRNPFQDIVIMTQSYFLFFVEQLILSRLELLQGFHAFLHQTVGFFGSYTVNVGKYIFGIIPFAL